MKQKKEMLSLYLQTTYSDAMNTSTPSTQGSTPQKSPSSAAGMGDDDVTPHVLFTDEVVDLENNAATHPLQSPSPPASVDIATPDAAAATSTQQNRPALNTCDSNRGYRVRRIFGVSESFAEEGGNEHSLIRMMYESIFAYVLLGTWAWTICALITLIHLKGCHDAFDDPTGANAETFDDCNESFTGSVACAHSIIFGLLSAVVVHETGTSDDTATHRLSSIAKPLLERRQKDANCLQRALFGMVVSLPTVYVVSWTVLGLFCFIFSLSTSTGSSGPLFYTGQTWLGISIKAAYSFFGVSPKNSTTDANNGSPDEKRREQQEVVDAEERLGPFQMINVHATSSPANEGGNADAGQS